MAGKMRFAAKLFLASAVLAGGGAGAWYFTAHGWPALAQRWSGGEADESDASRSDVATGFAGGDLDAVAGAWAEPAAAPDPEPPTARHIPHAAEVTMPVDRYDFSSKPVPPGDSVPVQAVAASEVEPAVAMAIEAAPGTASDDPDDATVEPTLAEPDGALSAAEPATESLARGQEPTEATDAAREPAPIEASDDAAPVSAVTADDRYGSSSIEHYGAAGVANPFSPAGAKSRSNAAVEGSAGTIAALPREPSETTGGPLPDLQPLAQERSAPTERKSPASVGRFDSEPISAEPLAEPTDAPSPSSGGTPSAAAMAESEGAGRPGERALEGPQRPALEIQKLAPPEIQVGKPAKFVVHVRNVGSQPADGVVIRDEVPQGTRLISTTPTAQNEGGQIVWQLGKLSPGEDRRLEMQLMPTSEGEIGSVATVSYAAQASVKTRCTMPQLAIRMTAPSKVLVGQEQRVKIELRNPGSGDATGVMLFENVPANVRHPAGPALEFEIGTLRAGETRELELVLLAEKPGKTVNVLSARAEGNLQVQQQVEFEIIAPALSIDVSGPERRYLERPATYEVTVENPGTAPAHNVQIVTKLPKGLRFVRANNMGEYDATAHAVYWSLAELPEGERGTVELVAMPVETGPQLLHVEGRASQGLSDQAQRQIVVDGLAAIMFELRDLVDPIEVGGETGYEVRVVNQGTKAATNVQLAVSLPPGMRLLSAEGETQHAEQRGTIIFEPIPQLAAKADSVFRLRVQGAQAGDQRVTVEVNTDDLAQPIRREESTRVFGDE